MKKVIFSAFMGLLCLLSHAQEAKKTSKDLIKFENDAHSFGKIPQGKPVTHDFTFTNISKEPIVIEKAQASCGCTTPKWPQEPIMPGKTGTINVGYNAAAVSPFEKTITIKIAGIDDMALLKISGEVFDANAKKDNTAPAAPVAEAQKSTAAPVAAPTTNKSVKKPAVKKAPAKSAAPAKS